MTYNRIVISSGHGKHVRGASGIIDEVDEARRVVDEVARMLKAIEVDVIAFHDNTSHSQNENLNTIVDFHNSQSRDLDISVHFNAYEQVSKPMGVEVLYVTQSSLAGNVSSAIASCGFINRGPKKRTDLFFLNNTTKPAILIEICFVDSEADTHIYNQHFMGICNAITSVLGGEGVITQPPPPGETHNLVGTVSHFGGPNDMGVSEDEGLAFIYEVEDAPHLFLPYQPEDTTGLARRLNPFIHYIACRWDYEDTSKDMLLREMALVRATKTGIALKAFPADWGPHVDTGRIADISPGLMMDLGIETDDEVEVIFPHRENL
jgi:N-acetylmuramoyl-L-alanine amidase